MAAVCRNEAVLAKIVESGTGETRDAGISRDRPQDREEGLRAGRSAAARGAAQCAIRAIGEGAWPVARADQRRRERRARRNRQSAHQLDGSPAYPRPCVRAADAGGTGAPDRLALLARAAADRQDRHLHECVVPRSAAGPGRRPHRRCRARRLSPGSAARGADARRRRHRRCSSSGSTCRAMPRRSGLPSSNRIRERAGGSRRRTSASSRSTASRTTSGSTCCAKRRPAWRRGTSSKAPTSAIAA